MSERAAGRRDDASIRDVLDAVRARADLRARRESDPVGFVHRFTDLHDRELVALVAASVLIGRATRDAISLPHPGLAALWSEVHGI